MTSPQDYVAVAMPARVKVPEPGAVDTEGENRLYYQAERVHISPALAEVRRIMREIRMTGKCGECTGKWNGSAWEFRKCEPPTIARE